MPKSSELAGWGVDDRSAEPGKESVKKYDKLVRDKIPQIMRSKGKRPKTHVVGRSEYKRRLAQKLMEESMEYANDPSLEELADVLEVIHSLCTTHNTTFPKLEKIRKGKAKERGSFKKRIILDSG